MLCDKVFWYMSLTSECNGDLSMPWYLRLTSLIMSEITPEDHLIILHKFLMINKAHAMCKYVANTIQVGVNYLQVQVSYSQVSVKLRTSELYCMSCWWLVYMGKCFVRICS